MSQIETTKIEDIETAFKLKQKYEIDNDDDDDDDDLSEQVPDLIPPAETGDRTVDDANWNEYVKILVKRLIDLIC